MSKCDDCFIYNNDEFSGMECCSSNCDDVKKWLSDHEKQIRNEVIEKFVAECNLKIHDIQMECEDDGIVFLCIEDIREIAKKLKGEQNE